MSASFSCSTYKQNCQRRPSEIWWNSRSKNGRRNKIVTEAEAEVGDEEAEEEEASQGLKWEIIEEETKEEWTTRDSPRWETWACR